MKRMFSVIFWAALFMCMSSHNEAISQKVFQFPNVLNKDNPNSNFFRVYDFATQTWEQVEWTENTTIYYPKSFFNKDQSVLYLFKNGTRGTSGRADKPAKLFSIDLATNSVKGEINFGEVYLKMSSSASPIFSPDGSRLYIPTANNAVLEIDLANSTHKVLEIPVGAIRNPLRGLEMTPDGSTLFIASRASIDMFDLRTGTYKGKLNISFGASDAAISPDGNTLYIASVSGARNELIAYDLSSKNITKRTPLNSYHSPGERRKIHFSPDGKHLYIISGGGPIILDVYDLKNFKIVRYEIMPIDAFVEGADVTSSILSKDGQRLYFAYYDNIHGYVYSASEYDISSHSVCKTVRLKGKSHSLAILPPPNTTECGPASEDSDSPLIDPGSPSTPIALIPSFKHDLVTVLNLQSGQIENEIPVGDGPQSVRHNLEKKEVYIGNQIDGTVSVIDPLSRTVKETYTLNLPTSAQLSQVIADPTGTTIYVTGRDNAGQGKLYLFDTNTKTLSATISLSGKPTDAILAKNGSQLFIAVSSNAQSALDIADLSAKTVQTIELSNQLPKAIAISPDGTLLFIAGENRATGNNPPGLLNIIDTALPTSDPAPLSLNGVPKFMSIQPNGEHLFIAGEQHVDQVTLATKVVSALPYTPLPGRSIEALIAGVGVDEILLATPTTDDPDKSDISKYKINPFKKLTTVQLKAVNGTAGSQFPFSYSSFGGLRAYSPDKEKNIVRVIDLDLKKPIATINVGRHPKGIAISPDNTRIYIANNEGNSLSVIDTRTNEVIQTVKIGEEPMGVCVSSDGSKVYVANVGKRKPFIQGSISIIDAVTFSEEKIEPVDHPYDVALSADEKELFVSNYYSNSVTRIDLTNKQIDPNTIKVERNPTGLTVSPDGKTLAVANFLNTAKRRGERTGSSSNIEHILTLSLIDLSQIPPKITSEIDLVGTRNEDVLFNKNGTKFYVLTNDKHIQEYDLSAKSLRTVFSSGTPIRNIDLHPNGKDIIGIHSLSTMYNRGYTPRSKINGYSFTAIEGNAAEKALRLYTNPSGNTSIPSILVSRYHEAFGRFITRGVKTPPPPITSTRAYIPNYGDGTVSVVNLSPGQPRLLTTIYLPKQEGEHRPKPHGVTVSPGGDHVFIADDNGSRIFVIDPFTNRVERIVSTGEYPREMVLNKDGSRLFVTDLINDKVEVFRTDTWESVASIPVGEEPEGIDISPDGKTVLVANEKSNNISVINTQTNTEIKKVAVGAYPDEVKFSPSGEKAYVTNGYGKSISVIDCSDFTVSKTITGFDAPINLCFNPVLDEAYIVDLFGKKIITLNSYTDTKTGEEFDCRFAPEGISINPDGNTLYVTLDKGENSDGELLILSILPNGRLRERPKRITVGEEPAAFGNFVRKP